MSDSSDRSWQSALLIWLVGLPVIACLHWLLGVPPGGGRFTGDSSAARYRYSYEKQKADREEAEKALAQGDKLPMIELLQRRLSEVDSGLITEGVLPASREKSKAEAESLRRRIAELGGIPRGSFDPEARPQETDASSIEERVVPHFLPPRGPSKRFRNNDASSD